MNIDVKRELKEKAKYTYGLLNVLEFDVDILREDASNFNLDKLEESVRDTEMTLHKLFLAVKELECIINMVRS